MVSRDRLIAYLLHQMPVEERLDFAEQWFTDQNLSEDLSSVEAEILDAYARATLPTSQRKLVERFLLNSDEQRQKLNFATVLGAALRKPPTTRRMPWLAIAAAVIVCLTGVIVWLAMQHRSLRLELASARAQAAKAAPGAVVTASLAAQDLRGASRQPTMQIPQGASMLRLELELPEGEKRPSYAAVVSTAGKRVWRQEPAKSEDKEGAAVAVVWIPADVLTAGRYTVVLEGDGGPVASYRVEIVRR